MFRFLGLKEPSSILGQLRAQSSVAPHLEPTCEVDGTSRPDLERPFPLPVVPGPRESEDRPALPRQVLLGSSPLPLPLGLSGLVVTPKG